MTSDSISIYIAGAAAGIYLFTTLFLGLELSFDLFRQKHQPVTPLMQIGGATMLCDFFDVLAECFFEPLTGELFWHYLSLTFDGLVAALFCLIGFTLIKGQYVSKRLAALVIVPVLIICLLACAIPVNWNFATNAIHAYVGVFYVYQCWKILKHDKQLKDYYSNIENRTLKWFFTFMAWFIINMLLYYFIYVNEKLGVYSHAIYDISMTFLYLFMAQQIFRQARLYIYPAEEALEEKESSADDTPTVTLPPAIQARIEEGLHQLIDEDKMFLQPDLTLKEVCNALNTNNTYLYYYMHNVMHKRFFQYINEYRIEEAKLRLQNTKEKIETIAFSCGFNTYSTFFTTFRNITGMTPREWRQKETQKNP